MSQCCADLARAASLPLGGTATRADRWLLLQVDGAWGRDALADSTLPEGAKARLQGWLAGTPQSRVLFIRRPRRSSESPEHLAFLVDTDETGGRVRRLRLFAYEELAEVDLDGAGEEIEGPLVLVCTHGRRDQCCARRGVPVYEALSAHVPGELLWQSSHQGGHRLAANVIALPHAVQLGQVEPADAGPVASALLAGRIPLEQYRGRTLYDPIAQAADVAVRLQRGLDRVEDVSVLGSEDGVVSLRAAGREIEVEVTEEEGPYVPASCGAAPEPSVRLSVGAGAGGG